VILVKWLLKMEKKNAFNPPKYHHFCNFSLKKWICGFFNPSTPKNVRVELKMEDAIMGFFCKEWAEMDLWA
jgi:hypothetical protein